MTVSSTIKSAGSFVTRLRYRHRLKDLEKAAIVYCASNVDVHEQKQAAQTIAQAMRNHCDPKGGRNKERCELIMNLLASRAFDQVYTTAQMLFMTSGKDRIAYHQRQNGQTVLQAVASSGLPTRTVDWHKVIERIVRCVETRTHYPPLNPCDEDNSPYHRLLFDILYHAPHKATTAGLFEPVAHQLAQRVVDLESAAKSENVPAVQDANCAPPEASSARAKRDRLFGLLVQSVFYSQVLLANDNLIVPFEDDEMGWRRRAAELADTLVCQTRCHQLVL